MALRTVLLFAGYTKIDTVIPEKMQSMSASMFASMSIGSIIYNGPTDITRNQLIVHEHRFETISEYTMSMNYVNSADRIMSSGLNIGTIDYIHVFGDIVVMFWNKTHVVIYDNKDFYEYHPFTDNYGKQIVWLEANGIYGSCLYADCLFVSYSDRHNNTKTYICKINDTGYAINKYDLGISRCPIILATRYRQLTGGIMGLADIDLGRNVFDYFKSCGMRLCTGLTDCLIVCYN